MLALAILLFLLLDAASLVAFGYYVGFWWAVLWGLAAFVLGLLVLRAAGPVTAFRVAGSLRRGEVPGRQLVDAVLMLAGALLLAYPGLLSDALALVLVTPGLRRIPRSLLVGSVTKRARVVRFVGGPPPEARSATDYVDVDFRRDD